MINRHLLFYHYKLSNFNEIRNKNKGLSNACKYMLDVKDVCLSQKVKLKKVKIKQMYTYSLQEI